MKRYNDYKDSGVEWIGNIPSHWEKSKVGYIGNYINGFAFNPSQWSDEGYKIIRIQNLTDSSKSFNFYNGKIDKKYIIKKGDILISWSATLDTFIWDDEDAVLNQHIFKVVVDEDKICKSYYVWLANWFISEMQNEKHGSTMQHLTKNTFDKFVVYLPPMEEQVFLAKYLDKKTSQIETLISKKEELIETLKASRTKLISETVTKGLDKNVPMKDSGVEWIGDIPSHYNVKKLRYLGNLQNGISKGSEEFGFGYPFVSYGDVYKNINISNEVEGLVNSSKEDRRIYSVIEGDVFFTRTSETIEEIGFASTCLKTIQNATFAGFLIRFRPNTNELYKGYSKYYFRSNIHRKFFVKEMNLVTRASLGQNLLKNLPVVIPSYEEQIEISNYLDKQVTIIDNSITKIQEQIEILKRAKQKLITEVVTGKIDVTNL